MDHNLPLMAKRIRKIERAVLFMLRKGITNSKIMPQLKMLIKRGKLAGKAMIGNLIFNHHGNHHNYNDDDDDLFFSGPYEYEFSCSNSPKSSHFICALPPLTPDGHDIETLNTVKLELEKLGKGVNASPLLPHSTLVRQVRVTDSPFPLQDINENGSQVDKAAEEFIQKFYRQLKKANKN